MSAYKLSQKTTDLFDFKCRLLTRLFFCVDFKAPVTITCCFSNPELLSKKNTF